MHDRSSASSTSPRHRPLAGETSWIISDGKAGHEALCIGVAEALGVKIEWKRVDPRGLWRKFAPYAPVAPNEKFGKPGSAFAAPWPAIALSTGRLTTPYMRALHRHAGPATYTIILLDPKTSSSTADLYWVPEHDKRRGENVISTVTSPHRFSPARLAELRAAIPAAIARLPSPRIALLVGGPNGDYAYDDATIARFTSALASLAAMSCSLMITPSRRTPEHLTRAIETAIQSTPHLTWDGTGENPYPAFLAHADAFIVTADSVNMAGEAAATGKPVFIFHPPGGTAKFSRFHDKLAQNGITRVMPERFTSLAPWPYTPPDSALEIAKEIEARWLKRTQKHG